ncbi:M56 family metallopeptidase [Lacinutrix jangbogonensis]|uniref:M56 family metallopeptidase n=1 Tax=Lacinutrix jangbogonensis TaxID=1469557 RepID=UPI00053EB417|nr:M56 family metallopeptidase [Lacinutrix jangbogonensis]
MLHYILQTVVFQLLFLLIYDGFLKKETFFNHNRFYLLASALLSIVLPFIKIDSFKAIIPKEYIYTLPEVVLGKTVNNINTEDAIVNTINTSSFYFSWGYLLYLGCAIALVLFVIKFYKLMAMAYKNPKVKFETAFLIELVNSKQAFSFFNYIFLGKDINTEDRQSILVHELQHVKEKHSLDLLFFEVLKIVFWFNPLIYMYQKRMSNLHEFIADSKAVKSSCKVNYYQNLLSQVFDTQKVSFINPFFKQSLIKKRINMLSKSKSKQIHLAKYLLLFPMVIGMLFYTSCETQIETPREETSQLTEQELQEKLKKELKGLSDEQAMKIIMSDDMFNRNNYLCTKEEYIKMMIIIERINKIALETATEENLINSLNNKLKSIKENTYENYLLRKEKQESIDKWQNSASGGVIKLHVKDLDNITTEEQKLIDSQVEQIRNDVFYHTQIISDGLRHKRIEFKVQNESISFASIDEVPVFPGCDTSDSNDNQRKCFSDKISKLVAKNFNLDLGKTLGLSGKQRIYTRFLINKEGNVVDIKARAPHPELEKEAKRVVQLIPQLQPGKQEGKPVSVAFDLPITFNIK